MASGTVTSQRVLVLGVLVVVGVLSLPVSAYFLDGQGTENLVLPVAVLVTAAVGAALGLAMPGVAGAGATRGRGAVVGAVAGVVMSLVGLVVLFLLLNGLSGA